MTLVATIFINDTPVVFGDMLITFDTGVESKNLELPTLGRLSSLPEIRPRIEGLWQKVCILDDHLAVAYAGDTGRARRVLGMLKKFIHMEGVSPQSLKKFYQQRTAYFGKDLAIIGAAVSKDKNEKATLTTICWGGTTISDPGLGEIQCAGTGTALLRNAAEERLIHPNGFDQLPGTVATLAKVLSVCGHLLSEEQKNKDSIVAHSTGGAYEIAFFDGKRFIKPAVTFLTWDWSLINGIAQISDPRFIMKSLFLGNVHLLNCMRRLPELVDGRNFWQPDLHVTYPIYEAPTAPISKYNHPGVIGYQSYLTQHQVSLLESNTRVKYISLVETGESKAFADCGDGEFKMRYEDSFLDKLVEIALN